MKLSQAQQEFLDNHGHREGAFDVATSNYCLQPLAAQWNPVCRVSRPALQGLKERGLINVKFFWRGATVEIIKES